MDNRNIKIIALVFVSLLVSTGYVLAFGVSSPYWKDNPLKMYPGETKEVSFNLQNCPSLSEDCDQKEANVLVSFEEGNEIAQITNGPTYKVPFGSSDTNVILKVSIPESASVGDSYNVKLSIGAPNDETGGNIQLGVGYNVEFPVNVVEEEITEKPGVSTTTIVVIVLLVLIAIGVLFWLLKKRK